MSHELFVLLIALLLIPAFMWGFRTLPKERWQILASVPRWRSPTGSWIGVNFTYYGWISATAYALAFLLFLLLMTAVQVPLLVALTISGAMLVCCLPAARMMAWLVEGKRNHLTIAGASFVGLLVAPIAIWLATWVSPSPMSPSELLIPSLSALAIAVTLGEGIGRLACISFGCCYGRPLESFSPRIRKSFEKISFRFSGRTKKISYAAGLERIQVFPIQALTVVFLSALGLTGTYLYLESHFAAALLVTVVAAQAWRIFSETLRADYRGPGRWTTYQQLGVLTILFTGALVFFQKGSPPPTPDLEVAIAALWTPQVILAAELVWSVVFLFSGRSLVTGSVISVHVVDP